MVTLRQDSRGNYSARKRLPDDVREEYGRLYRARHEAKFSAPASLGKQIAQQKFHQWATEVEQRIDAIRKMQRGEGLDLDREQATALAGEWYLWFVAKYEKEGADCMSSGHFGRLAWQFKRVSGSSGLKVQAAIAC